MVFGGLLLQGYEVIRPENERMCYARPIPSHVRPVWDFKSLLEIEEEVGKIYQTNLRFTHKTPILKGPIPILVFLLTTSVKLI